MAKVTVSQKGAYIETHTASVKTAQFGAYLEVSNAYRPKIAQFGAYIEVSTPLTDKYGPKIQVI